MGAIPQHRHNCPTNWPCLWLRQYHSHSRKVYSDCLSTTVLAYRLNACLRSSNNLMWLTIYTTKGDASVCLCTKFDQFLPVRSHFDTKHPVHFFHIATFPSPTFGPLFAFHCPLFFTKNNN